jgi:hypothetical protein
MMGGLVQSALIDMELLNGVFLSASRHLAQNNKRHIVFEELALHYKLACVQSVSKGILTNKINVGDSIIANVLMLAWDEVRQ